MRSSAVRFAVEAVFLGLVAAVLWWAHLGAAVIIVVMLLAWALTAVAEGLAWRGWQGAATFVPPLRPIFPTRAPREAELPAWQPEPVPPEEVAPAWLESAEVLGVHVSGFEPAEQQASEEHEQPVSGWPVPPPADVVAEEVEPEPEPEPEAAPEVPEAEAPVSPPPRPRRVGRSRLPRRFVTQSGRARPAAPAPAPASAEAAAEAADEEPGAETPEPGSIEPVPSSLTPVDRRWPWRKLGRPAPEREPRTVEEPGEAHPELPLFEVPERLCSTCGRPISRERLRAIPGATQCIDCKRAGVLELAEIPDFEAPEAPAGGVSELVADLVAGTVQEPAEEPDPDEEPALEPEFASEPEPVYEQPVVQLPERAPAHVFAGGEWNVWELERLARSVGGRDAARDEEWAFLLVYLREFANPEGVLPADFDALVRESFPELVAAAEAP